MTTIALEQARQHLETLGLKQAVEALDNSLDIAASKQLTYPEMLAELLGVEVSSRRERYLTTRTKLAHLPFQRTLEQFDFTFQPSIDERQVKELASLAQGLGHSVIRDVHTIRFLHADDFHRALAQAWVDHSLNRTFRSVLSPAC